MQLPKIDVPIYEVQLLSREQPVKYRPFLVKEQKIMLMAVEAKDMNNTMKAIKQIITNCVIDPIDVDELPLADIETLFLHLRARSMGEVLNLFFKCTNKIGDVGLEVPCGMLIEVPVNLLQVPQINKDTPKKIMISDDVGVIMKYPALSIVDNLMKMNSEVMVTVAAYCIDQVFDGENVYYAKDSTPEEMITFVENLPAEKFALIEDFIDKVPRSVYKTNQKCVKCGFEHEFVLEGLSDFFI